MQQDLTALGSLCLYVCVRVPVYVRVRVCVYVCVVWRETLTTSV